MANTMKRREKNVTGQINLGSAAGDKIKETCELDEISTIVEIGTWNGQGSTRCVLAGVKNRGNIKFCTLECARDQYELAVSLNPNNPKVEFILGKIVNEDELDVENLSIKETTWLKNDIIAMKDVPNVLEQIPSKIDFLLLDGGEFSTSAELKKLIDRCNYIFLDDTVSRKNRQNRIRLINSINFELLEDRPTDRHGWSLFKRAQTT